MNTEHPHRTAAEADRRAVSPRRGLAIVASLLAFAVLPLTAVDVTAQDGVVELLEEDVQHGVLAAKAIGDASATPELEIGSAAISVKLPSGRLLPGYLITAHEPESGLFWWTFQGADPSDPADRLANLPADLAFFVSDREIVGIELGTAPPALWILRSTERVDSFAAGREAALARIAKSAPRIEQGTARWMRVVSLANALPRDFYYELEHAMPKLELKVASIERDGADWKVTLEGREGRMAEVRLDHLLVLEGARELETGTES